MDKMRSLEDFTYSTIHWVVVRHRIIGAIVFVTNEIMTTNNQATRSKAPAQSWVGIVDLSSDQYRCKVGNDDTYTSINDRNFHSFTSYALGS